MSDDEVTEKTPTILGSDVTQNENDIYQGGLGDCYFLAAISAIGTNKNRLDYTMLTENINDAGVFAMKVYVKGVPTVVVVDDYIPFYNAYGESSSYTLLWA